MVNPLEQHVERDLLHDKAIVKAAAVDVMRIPLAKVVVGPLVDRMIEVVGPGIEGQLVEPVQIELGFAQDRLVGGAQDIECPADDLGIASDAHPRVADNQGHGAQPLVGVGLDPLRGAQHGNGAMAHVVVQLRNRAVNDTVGFVPRRPLRKTASHARPTKNGRQISASVS